MTFVRLITRLVLVLSVSGVLPSALARVVGEGLRDQPGRPRLGVERVQTTAGPVLRLASRDGGRLDAPQRGKSGDACVLAGGAGLLPPRPYGSPVAECAATRPTTGHSSASLRGPPSLI